MEVLAWSTTVSYAYTSHQCLSHHKKNHSHSSGFMFIFLFYVTEHHPDRASSSHKTRLGRKTETRQQPKNPPILLHSRRHQNPLLCGIGFPSAGQRFGAVGGRVTFDLGLELRSEMSDETLNGPRESFT